MVKKYFGLFIIVSLFIGCDICYWVPVEKMTYKDKLVFNNEIKIQGYYLDSSNKPMDNIYLTFYSNGFVNSIKSNSYDTTAFHYLIRKNSWGWGYYYFDNDIIKCQFVSAWGAHSFHKYPIVEEWYRIINDTTILLFKGINHLGTEYLYNDTLIFKNDKAKCDSNCVFLRCVKEREMKVKKR